MVNIDDVKRLEHLEVEYEKVVDEYQQITNEYKAGKIQAFEASLEQLALMLKANVIARKYMETATKAVPGYEIYKTAMKMKRNLS